MTAEQQRGSFDTVWDAALGTVRTAGRGLRETLVSSPEPVPHHSPAAATATDDPQPQHQQRIFLGVCRAIAGDSPTALLAVRGVMAAMIVGTGVGIVVYLLLWLLLPADLTRGERPSGGPLRSSRGSSRGSSLRIFFEWAGLVVLTGIVVFGAALQLHASGVWWPAAIGLGLALGAPLLLLHRSPLAVWRVMVAAHLASLVLLSMALTEPPLLPWPITGLGALGVVLYFVAIRYPDRVTGTVGVLTVLAVPLPTPLLTGTPVMQSLGLLVGVGFILGYGHSVRGRRMARQDLQRESELRRQDQARQAVLKERSRIARELHDVVSHHMSMIAIHADAAPYKHPEMSTEVTTTFHMLRDTARDALGEMRRVVGLLREETDQPEREPQPGLAQLETLVAGVRAAGVEVELRARSFEEPLPDAVDVSVYRIVQEALSNASRHAPGAAVTVSVTSEDGGLLVWVRNEPVTSPHNSGNSESSTSTESAGNSTGLDAHGGHGLLGMRERVMMLGGSLHTAPAADGGFEVMARLPIVGTGWGVQ